VISFLANASQLVLFLLGTFLIVVILLQRGRGGGLAGAFGGMGGQSAFGTKAGDVFTRITIILAICWVILAGGSGYLLRAASQGTRAGDYGSGDGATTETGETGTDGASGTAGATAPDGSTQGGARSSLGAGANTDPASNAPSGSDGNSATHGTKSSGGTTTPEKDTQPAPANTPDAGSTATPSADTPAPASSTPGQPTQSPQDK
jgi:preprotein translocase subunit SecG